MAFDPWAQTNQGLSNLTNTLGTLAQLKRQDQQYADEKPLRALQTQQAQQSVDQGKLTLASLKGQQDALVGEYGTAGHTDPLGSAMTFQAQEKKMQDQQKQMMEKQKHAFDTFASVSKAVKDGLLSETDASAYYRHNLKLAGIDLDAAGVKMEFKKQGGFYSGKVTPDALFMINGKPTPFGSEGIVEKARVVGQDPDTLKPIFEQDENTTFKPETKTDTSHNVHKQLSADGKTAQDFQYNPKTERYDIKLGEPYAVPSQVPNVNVTTGPAPVAQTTFVDPTSGQPLVFDKKTGTYRVSTVEGSGVAPKPSAMSPEAAGKAQMVEQATTYIPTLRKELFDEDGSVNHMNVTNLVARTWGTRGRELSTLILDAVEAKLRVESGAAVPEPEVKRAAKRFMPQLGDSANGVKIKLDNLETYLKGTAQKFNTGRSGQTEQAQPKQGQAKSGSGKKKPLSAY